jgi:cytochrome c peroxidase
MRPRRLVALAFALPLATGAPAAAVAATLQPKLPDLTGIVKDPKWAVVLGKALFWEVSVGSDGMACASCHFHAGADARIKNALSPGLIELPESTWSRPLARSMPPSAASD